MLPGEAGERVDLGRDAALLVKRERDGGDDVRKGGLRRVGARDLGSSPWSSRKRTIISAWLRSSSACA